MDKAAIEQVLIDQQEELSLLRSEKLVARPEESLINLDSRLAQVVIGVRRSGKSTLCFRALEKSGVKYAYVNFDDERFAKLKSEDLGSVLETLYKVYGEFNHLFLDEIQNIEGWPLFVNRLLRQRLHLVITGSNAKLLSSELSSHLTGRHHTIELFPFSFKEWCETKELKTDSLTTKNRGLLAKAFEEYLKIGGFPELVYGEYARTYISELFNNIVEQDIQRRFRVRNIDELKVLANHILNEVPDCFKLDDMMQLCGINSDHTVVKYISYMKQTYLISSIARYSAKSRQRARNEKYYAIDVAFMDNRENAFAGDNLGWRLETVVYIELRRRYPSNKYDIYYLKEKSSETDFIVFEGNRTIGVFQVSYDISSEKTRNREFRGCLNGSNKAKCDNIFLITNNQKEEITIEGKTIKVLPAYEWMLSEA